MGKTGSEQAVLPGVKQNILQRSAFTHGSRTSTDREEPGFSPSERSSHLQIPYLEGRGLPPFQEPSC